MNINISHKNPRGLFSRTAAKRIGLPPGTLLSKETGESVIARKTLFEYTESAYREEVFKQGTVENLQDSFFTEVRKGSTVSWLNVDGLKDTDFLERIGKYLDIHPLILEDIQNLDHRPKIEDHNSYIFMTFKMLQWDEAEKRIHQEQVSLILSKVFVITFQEKMGDVFSPVRERIRTAKGRVRKSGADYLAYTLIDSVIDNYYLLIEKLESEIVVLEDSVMSDSLENVNAKSIHNLKKELILLRRAVWPLREMLHECLREEYPLLTANTRIYLKDVFDHVVQVMEAIEMMRDLLSGLMDSYNAHLSNRTNSVMRVLTVIATIFIPLTFVAGIYGMNFSYMPELLWKWGYFTVLGVMTVITLIMILFFRRKKWL